MDSSQKAGQKAFEYHCAGYHCAEAVALAVVEAYGPQGAAGLPRAASAMGGGLGATHQDLCGALNGGVLAAGILLGRDAPGTDWKQVQEIVAELRRRFLGQYGATSCPALLIAFGPQKDMMRCKQLSGETASLLAAILEERGLKPR